jgi:ribosomal protein S18 acetylase RimI-like enzyme
VIDLDEPPPPPPPTVRPIAGGEDETFLAVANAGFAEHWNSRPFERSWLDGADRTLLLVAVEDATVVGAVKAIEERFDMGWVNMLSVHPAARRRGHGLALLQAAFAELYRRGVRTVGLGVDAANPTGATRLYERAGMRVAWQAATYEKQA